MSIARSFCLFSKRVGYLPLDLLRDVADDAAPDHDDELVAAVKEGKGSLAFIVAGVLVR
jgi:hypothetical protein